VNSAIVFVAKYFLYLSILITVWFWLKSVRETKIELGARLILGGILALALSALASHLYYDPRPFVTQHITPLFAHAADNGFPSDHVLFTSFLGFTVFFYSRRVGSILLAIAVIVGAARVAAHVHNPQDIVGSFVISAISVAVIRWLVTSQRLKSLVRR
jgi:undecaprenyl-diphosphatase